MIYDVDKREAQCQFRDCLTIRHVPDSIYDPYISALLTRYGAFYTRLRPRKRMTHHIIGHFVHNLGYGVTGDKCEILLDTVKYQPWDSSDSVSSNYIFHRFVAKQRGKFKGIEDEYDNIWMNIKPRKRLTFTFLSNILKSFGMRVTR